jgi:mannose-1-phosphate guanylyltransferase
MRTVMGIVDCARHWGLILAGGDGTRLQELTREITGQAIPKQYCRLFGERSLLEATLDRVQHFAPLERMLVIVNHHHLTIGGEQLRRLRRENVLVQPCNRDTGPGILFALGELARKDARATVAVFPSDHYVNDDRAFTAHVEHAARVVGQCPDKIVVLGICPDYAEPGYGYVAPRRLLQAGAGPGAAFHVAAFQEKPGPALARQLVKAGWLWNSFVMVFRLARMLELIRRVAPDEFEHMQSLSDGRRPIGAIYDEITPWNFSSRVLARIPEHLVVVRVDDVHWSDWGTRACIERTLRALKQVPPWQNEQARAG